MTIDWLPDGAVQLKAPVSAIVIESVLVDIDGPRIFTTRHSGSSHLLWYVCDDAATEVRHVVVPITTAQLAELRAGRLSVLETLLQPLVWLIDVRPSTEGPPEVQAAWEVSGFSLPQELLPAPGILLTPALEPLLCVRLLGADLLPGSI